MSTFIVLVIISLLVIIHELGHFILAKKNKIKVEEFGLGYPPKIYKLFKWRGTEFTLNAIPFGGFVRLEGEDGPEVEKDKKSTKPTSSQSEKSSEDGLEPFYKKSSKSRIAVILAGSVVNFLFGVVAFTIIFSVMGIPTPLGDQPRIDEIAIDSPAEKAGLPTDVNLLSIKIDDQEISVKTIEDVQKIINENLGKTVEIKTTGKCEEKICIPTSQKFSVYLRTKDEIPEGQGSIGVAFANIYFKYYPWYEMPVRGAFYGLGQAFMLGGMILQALGNVFADLFRGRGLAEDIAGPVGIVHQAQEGDLFQQGFLTWLNFAGMLSVNLAVMNMLPIPALDGGRALFIFLEKIIGKKIIQKVEGYVNYGGFALLLALIILVTIRDVSRIEIVRELFSQIL